MVYLTNLKGRINGNNLYAIALRSFWSLIRRYCRVIEQFVLVKSGQSVRYFFNYFVASQVKHSYSRSLKYKNCCFLRDINYSSIWLLRRFNVTLISESKMRFKMAAACDVIYLTIVAMETNWTPRGFAYIHTYIHTYIHNLFGKEGFKKRSRGLMWTYYLK